MSEVLALGERGGISGPRALELLAGLPVTSPAATGAAALMVSGDHAPRFPVRLVEKDLRYAVAGGGGPVLDAVRERFGAAVVAGLADANLTAIRAL
ncbi:MAG: hypothetical protein R3F61_35890 [Myxococcota bacterium]